jgi:hypothetical protein
MGYEVDTNSRDKSMNHFLLSTPNLFIETYDIIVHIEL